jgi:hypothetical protein
MNATNDLDGERVETHEPKHGNTKGQRNRKDSGNNKRGANANRSSRITLVPFEAIKLSNKRRDLVKNLIPRAGLAVVWGPPKCCKSFWVLDLFLHVALGWEYRSRRVHQGPVVYCAFEGQTGIEARIEAFRQRFLAEHANTLPFFLEPVTLNLVRDHLELIEVIKLQLGKSKPVAVVFDTLNRSFQGSESSDEDMTAYVKAADAVREAFDCAVIVVHHCGHDASRPRGHSSLLGAAAAVVRIRKESDGRIVAEVELMKDGSQGEVIASRLEIVEVGVDEDGEHISSGVIVPAEIGAAKDQQRPGPESQADRALTELEHLIIAEKGRISRGHNRIPDGAILILRSDWRAACLAKTLSDGDPDNEKKAFNRAVTKLSELQIIGDYGKEIWLTKKHA